MSNNVMEIVQVNTDIVEVKERSLLDKRELYINLKRGADIVISSLALVILLPFIAIISVLIKIDSKGKVFYKQTRIGKNGKYFTIYKFRTMVSDANNFSKYFTKEQMEKYKINYKLDNDPRITKMGKILRKNKPRRVTTINKYIERRFINYWTKASSRWRNRKIWFKQK